MSKNYHVLALTFISLLLVGIGCTKTDMEAPIVQQDEIRRYLTEEAFNTSTELNRIEQNISFWKDKLAADPEAVTYHTKLGSAYAQRFSVTKDIRDLQKADSLLNKALDMPGGNNVGTMHALANLSITKHHFKEAYEYSNSALEIGDEKRMSMQLKYDAMMERGDYQLAGQILDRLQNPYSFSYLVRLSKFKDYEGQLDSAMHYMEKAQQVVDHSNNLTAWSKSNLADMYGHANQVRQSYEHYLEVLAMTNTGGSYLHSLKGIAWITYAYDKNPELAKEILHFVDEQIHSPDIKPMLAEIAEYEGDAKRKEQLLRAFVKEARKPRYFGMYDATLIDIAATEIDNTDWAMELVEKELTNRPSPQIYDLMAWTLLHRDKPEKALEIIKKHVEGQTHEPVPAYHMAKVYHANGLESEARKYFEEALAAGYELGPVTVNDIKEEMKNL